MIQFTRFDHLLLSIPPGKTAEARVFYGQVLGLTEIPGHHPGGAIWFSIADIQLHLREEAGQTLSARHPAFDVADLEGAKQELEQKGIAMTRSTPIEGRDRLFFRDPFGNRIELIEFSRPLDNVVRPAPTLTD